MAVRQDLLTRIRNIHWAAVGAIFIIITRDGPYYCRVVSRNFAPVIQKIELPEPPGKPIQVTLASSYKLIPDSPARPMFLICGVVEYSEGDEAVGSASAIWSSSNGLVWHHRFIAETGYDFDISVSRHPVPYVSSSNAVVWKTDAFYFDQYMIRGGLPQVNTPTGTNQWRHDQIYRSLDGVTWTGPISDEQIWYGAEPGEWRSVFPPTYCAHNNCIDTLEQNVPDGFMRNDTRREVLMRPKVPITINYGIPSFVYGTSNVVEKIVRSSPPIFEVTPSLTDVACVAGANGIWMAGGQHGAKLSFDAGATWTSPIALDGKTDFRVLSISAAPQQDVRSVT